MLLLRRFVRFYNKRYDYSKPITSCGFRCENTCITYIKYTSIYITFIRKSYRFNNRIFSTFTKWVPAYLYVSTYEVVSNIKLPKYNMVIGIRSTRKMNSLISKLLDILRNFPKGLIFYSMLLNSSWNQYFERHSW